MSIDLAIASDGNGSESALAGVSDRTNVVLVLTALRQWIQADGALQVFSLPSAFIMNQGCYIDGNIVSHLRRIVFCQTVKNSHDVRLQPPAK